MDVVYAKQPRPEQWASSIFLAGPTPRSAEVPSWRPAALRALEQAGFDGVVFVPEDEDGEFRGSYLDQVSWERDALHASDVILFWVPRQLDVMPAFTTNVEFGTWASSGKIVLGFPEGAPKCRYLGWLAGEHGAPVCHTLNKTVQAAINLIGPPAVRTGGARLVPLQVWRTPAFQAWLAAQQVAGNRLDHARLLWSFQPSRATMPFAWIVKVSVWVEAEQRHKSNEWVFARSDMSAVVLHGPRQDDWRETEIVLVREFRAPVRTADGFVHELPGGSTYDPSHSPRQVAAEEVSEEVGLTLSADRLVAAGSRQLAGTLSAHHGHAFSAALSAEELDALRRSEADGTVFGVGDSERTTVSIRTVGELLTDQRIDWSTLGMVLSIFSPAAASPAATTTTSRPRD
ncbi:MAG: 8-oxo-dGTP pyrophosphatase MutT (NUDIX family) [Myxococcota bacterium]